MNTRFVERTGYYKGTASQMKHVKDTLTYVCDDCGAVFETEPIGEKDYIKALKLIENKRVEIDYLLENEDYAGYVKDMEDMYDKIPMRMGIPMELTKENRAKWLKGWCLTEEEWEWLVDIFKHIATIKE